VKRCLLLVLALVLPAFFLDAQAANSCGDLFVPNGKGVPPVVTGSQVDVGVLVQPSEVAFIYVDGGLVLTAFNPGTEIALLIMSVPNVPLGSHILQSTSSQCTLDFSNVAAPPPVGTAAPAPHILVIPALPMRPREPNASPDASQ
jgi:hypothetical protein